MVNYQFIQTKLKEPDLYQNFLRTFPKLKKALEKITKSPKCQICIKEFFPPLFKENFWEKKLKKALNLKTGVQISTELPQQNITWIPTTIIEDVSPMDFDEYMKKKLDIKEKLQIRNFNFAFNPLNNTFKVVLSGLKRSNS